MRTGGELGEQDPETSIRPGDRLTRVSSVRARSFLKVKNKRIILVISKDFEFDEVGKNGWMFNFKVLAVFIVIFPQSSGYGEGNDWEEEEKSGALRKREGSAASSFGSVFSTGSQG